MNFEMPNAVAAMNNAVAAVGDAGECWDVIGQPLDEGVDKTIPAYDAKLELNLNPKSGPKREEVSGLHWGRIDKDVARLNGLVAAIDNISSVVKKGKDQLAHDWKGKSFDAFRAAVERVEKTLNDYSAAVKTTAKGLGTATSGIRTQYSSYRDNSKRILAFDGLAKPDQWRKITNDDCQHFADVCPTNHFDTWGNCTKDDDQQAGIIVGHLVTQSRYDTVSGWRCNRNAGLVLSQYRDIVKWSDDEKSSVQGKIHEWYVATDQLRTGVGKAYQAALENLRIIAELKVFSTMTVPGTASPNGHPGGPGGGPPPGGGGPPPGGGGPPAPPSSGGDHPPGGDTSGSGADHPPTKDDPAQTKPETVEIKDGDRTIAVDSPDGQGHVKVTVDDGTGKPKSYDLDFGTGSTPPGTAPPGASPGAHPPGTAAAGGADAPEPVRAGADGKAVIHDGPLTITAEHPPGAADKVTVTVDDGSGHPTTYTLDYADQADHPNQADHPGQAHQPDQAHHVHQADPRVHAGGGTGPGVIPAATEVDPATGQPAQPTGTTGSGGAQVPVNPAGGPGAVALDPAANPLVNAPVNATVDPGTGQPAVADPTQTTAQSSSQSSSQSGYTDSGDWGAPGAAALGHPGLAEPDGRGEASLGAAADDAAPPDESAQSDQGAGGMAGGMPMAGGGPTGGGADSGRAASAWRVHGDLFDDGFAGSIRGVVGEDEG